MGRLVQVIKKAIDDGKTLLGAASPGEGMLDGCGDVSSEHVGKIGLIDLPHVGRERREALESAGQVTRDDGLVEPFRKRAVVLAHPESLPDGQQPLQFI